MSASITFVWVKHLLKQLGLDWIYPFVIDEKPCINGSTFVHWRIKLVGERSRHDDQVQATSDYRELMNPFPDQSFPTVTLDILALACSNFVAQWSSGRILALGFYACKGSPVRTRVGPFLSFR